MHSRDWVCYKTPMYKDTNAASVPHAMLCCAASLFSQRSHLSTSASPPLPERITLRDLHMLTTDIHCTWLTVAVELLCLRLCTNRRQGNTASLQVAVPEPCLRRLWRNVLRITLCYSADKGYCVLVATRAATYSTSLHHHLMAHNPCCYMYATTNATEHAHTARTHSAHSNDIPQGSCGCPAAHTSHPAPGASKHTCCSCLHQPQTAHGTRTYSCGTKLAHPQTLLKTTLVPQNPCVAHISPQTQACRTIMQQQLMLPATRHTTCTT
jgi:hypothetical protein